jgi:DEAD/DEAH box helicase domain-containing protein
MPEIVIDIETQNTFADFGPHRFPELKVSVAVIYDYTNDKFLTFREEQLKDMWPLLERADRVIGYNSRHFDLTVLNNYYSGDLTKLPQLDILEQIKNALGFRLKLNDVAKATLGIEKSGHGLQAIEWFKTGEWDKIEKYCVDDVRITRDLYEFGKKNRQLFFTELSSGKTRAFPVNFTPPVAKPMEERHNINLTLPF